MCSIINLVLEAIRKDSMFCNIQDREIEDTIQKYLAQRPFVVKRNEQISKNVPEDMTEDG